MKGPAAGAAAGTAPLPQATASVGVLLVLHAFAAGCTALTGVEALSNGVPAFRPPEARNAMLPLYAIGVFTSFTFSQAGMTRRHLRLREQGWRYGVVVNGSGALVTFLVLLDIVATKFAGGAWMVLVTVPLLVLLLDRTNRAYAREWEELAVEASEVLGPPKPRHEVLVLVDGLDRAVPLEVVHCPNRDLVDCAVDAVAARVRPPAAAASAHHPPGHEFPASRHARRRPELRS